MKFAILLLISWSLDQANAATGTATMYGGNLNGNACGMSGTASAYNNWKYAAIGGSEFDSGYGCGKCYKITCKGPSGNNPSCKCGSNPTITVQAIDQCPECSASHFDLNDDALAYITGSASMAGTCGKIKISYSRVDCTAIKSNFYIKNKGGTSKYWYGFHLNDVNDDGGIKTVTLYKNGKQVGTCDKSQGPSFWICKASSGSFPDTPLSIKIKSDKGKSVTANNCITSYSGNKVMKCNTNLGGSAYTEEEDNVDTTGSIVSGVIAIILVLCVCIAVGGYCFIKRRKKNAEVSFGSGGGDSDAPISEGDDQATKTTTGYDMSPINTRGDTPVNGDTPVGDDTPAGDDGDGEDNDDEAAEIEVDVEVTQN